MKDVSSGALIGLGCLLCFASGLGGALLALAIDDPDVVVTEQVVEVAPAAPPLAPSPAALEDLKVSYVERTGAEDEWTVGLIEEIGAAVCDGDLSASGLVEAFGQDLELDRPELDDFVDEVRAVCPAS